MYRVKSFFKEEQDGDPLSPFLFDLVADVLNRILHKAQENGHMEGINLGTVDNNILNLHFVDDTLFLFFKVDAKNIETLKEF